MKVGIIDYSAGNVSSLISMLDTLKYEHYYTNNEKTLSNCDLIILPGVGNFNSAIREINKRNLFEFIKSFKKSNKIIGICLGMQLLANTSTESGFSKGLGLIPGNVKRIKNNSIHIGWNNIEYCNKKLELKKFDGKYFYFNHAYEYITANKYKYFISNNNSQIASIIIKENIIGLQFHPEKSQINGIKLFKTLVEKM